jgi:molybdopterin converting factor small subunit
MSFSVGAMIVCASSRHARALALRIGRVGGRDEWYRRGMTDAAETISVKLFAGLELRAREPRTEYRFDPREAATVGAVTEAIGLEPGAAGLILVNGVHASRDQSLAPDDEVALFPPLGGG